MHRHAAILVLIPLAAMGGTVQRRTAAEIAAGAVNAPGEATYSVEDGAAVLRVGTSDAGTLVVSDPYAVHFAPRRPLGRTEYSVEISPGAQWMPDGSILLATNVTGSAVVTNTVTVRSLGPDLAGVDFDVDGGGHFIRKTLAGAVYTIRAETRANEIGGVGTPGHCSISNIRPYVWASDRRGAEWDATLERVTLRDTVGAVEMSDLRGWIVRRYDPQTADHWAQHPATQAVRLDGQALYADHGRLLAAQARRIEGGSRLDISAAGTAVLSIDAPASGPTADIDILDFSVATNGLATVVVDAALGVAPSLQTRQSLDTGNWSSLSGVTAATGTFDGRPCYILTFSAGNASSAFYRATATIPGDGAPRAVRIQDCELWIDGRKYERETWTFTTTGGVEIVRGVLVETVP